MSSDDKLITLTEWRNEVKSAAEEYSTKLLPGKDTPKREKIKKLGELTNNPMDEKYPSNKTFYVNYIKFLEKDVFMKKYKI